MYLRRVPLTLLAFLALIVQLLLVVGALSLFDHPGGPPPPPPALSGASPPNRDPLDPAAVPPSPSARPYVPGPLSQERHQRDSRSVCSPFYLAWTGPAAAFGPRQRTTLNSIVYQMPCAPVIVLSSAPLAIDLGSVNVQNLSTALLASLSAGVPAAEEWVAKLPEWRKQSADWNAHLSDFVRYAVLYQRGGSFSDFDTIYLRSIGGITNAVGRATHPDCLWKRYAAQHARLHPSQSTRASHFTQNQTRRYYHSRVTSSHGLTPTQLSRPSLLLGAHPHQLARQESRHAMRARRFQELRAVLCGLHGRAPLHALSAGVEQHGRRDAPAALPRPDALV